MQNANLLPGDAQASRETRQLESETLSAVEGLLVQYLLALGEIGTFDLAERSRLEHAWLPTPTTLTMHFARWSTAPTQETVAPP